jgi:hypothetical protein
VLGLPQSLEHLVTLEELTPVEQRHTLNQGPRGEISAGLCRCDAQSRVQ